MFWDSQADSGYSVDNLAPNAPGSLVGSVVANTVQLHWSPNSDSDLGGYAIFRSSVPGFNPDTMKAYATTSDTIYTDANLSGGPNLYYVLRAVDIHGNQSSSSNQISVMVTAIQDTKTNLPTKFALEQNYPNPFNPTTQITYQLKSAVNVRITVYDITGREVAVLVDKKESAGEHAVTFRGDYLSSGMYFYRLRAGNFTSVKKMILLK